MMDLADINLLAVLVAAVATFALGALWYSPPLFAKPWQALVKMTPKQLKENMVASYIGSFFSYLITAYALAYFIDQLKAEDAMQGAIVGSLLAFGFVVPITLSNALFHNTPRTLWLINTGYAVVSFLLMGVILGAWK